MLGKTFRGGVHPPECKHYAPHTVYEPRGELVYPLSQHIGKPAKPVVGVGDRVLVGQKIAERDGYISSCIHSSVSGTVKAIERRATIMGSGECIVVDSDGLFETCDGLGRETGTNNLSPEDIIALVREAGVVGLGGASFPTPVKLEPKDRDAIKYVILNGAECEPYITCDDDLMRQNAPEIVEGLRLLLRIFNNAEGVILIEDNKPEAIAAMEKAVEGEEKMRIHVAPVKYPQGGERAVIKVVTGLDTKLSQLPADVGCIVDNVATVYAIYEAVVAVCAALAIGVSLLTGGIVEQRRLAENAETYRAVLPGAESFEVPDGAKAALDELDGGAYGDFGSVRIDEVVAAKDAAGNDLGTVVSVTNPDGRDAPISLSVGILPDGTLNGIVYTDLNETPGIGMKVADASFTDQFVGIKADRLTVGSEIDAAAGATVSSEAVVNAVNAALDFYAAHVRAS